MNKLICEQCGREGEYYKSSVGDFIYCKNNNCNHYTPIKEENKEEPIINRLISNLKSRKLRKKQEEIELLKLDIEKAKLEKELKELIK